MKLRQAKSVPSAEDLVEPVPDRSLTSARHVPPLRRFHFNLTNGHDMHRDSDGIELRDLDEARIYAYQAIRDLKEEEPDLAQTWEDWRLEITNAEGQVECTIDLEWPGEANLSVH